LSAIQSVNRLTGDQHMAVSTPSIEASKGSTVTRFSTADYAPRDRLAAWHDIFGKTLVKLDIEPLETEAFHADVRIRSLPGLRIMAGSRSAATYHRTPACINNDDLVLSFGVAGGFEAEQSGRTATMQPGDAVIVTSAEPGPRFVSVERPFAHGVHSGARDCRTGRDAMPAHSGRQCGVAPAQPLCRRPR
jgi:hypothetical protein